MDALRRTLESTEEQRTGTSPIDGLLAELADAVPGSVADGRVDWDRLRALFDEPEEAERYVFRWRDKQNAATLFTTRSRGWLRPDRENSVNWDKATHVFVEGESLEVLKALYEAYFGQVRLVYLDAPYNGGDDRLYEDDYSEPLGAYLRAVEDSAAGILPSKNPRSADGFHSRWLSFLYPRLAMARQLLRMDGFIVVSVDDEELYHLRLVLNETFGEENHLATVVWNRGRKNDAKFFSSGHDYMVVYAKNLRHLRQSGVVLRAPKEGIDEIRDLWERLREQYADDFPAIQRELRKHLASIPEDDPRYPLTRFRKVDARGPYRDDADISWHGGGGPTYDVLHPVTGKPVKLPTRGWVFPTKARMDEEIAKGNVAFREDDTQVPALRSYLFEKSVQVMSTVQSSYTQPAINEFDQLFGGVKVLDNPKPYGDIRMMIEYLTDEDDIVLDFFARSGSTGHAVFDANRRSGSRRRFLLVQMREALEPGTAVDEGAASLGLRSVADVCRERLRRAIGSYQSAPPAAEEGSVPEDLGFRSFYLTESAFAAPPEPVDDSTAELFVDRMRSGLDPAEVAWEIALENGLPLSSRVDELEAGGARVFRFVDDLRDRSIHVTLDESVVVDVVDELELTMSDLFICRDSAINDDTATNLVLRCQVKTV